MLEIEESSEMVNKSLLYFNALIMGVCIILFLSELDKNEIKIKDKEMNLEYQEFREMIQILRSIKERDERRAK